MRNGVNVWKIDGPYAWRFSITFNDDTWIYSGVPNYCQTKHQAICRAKTKLRIMEREQVTKLIKKLRYKEWNCLLQEGQYPGGRVALFLTDEDDGEPVSTCTVNIPSCALDDNEVLIKDYSENEGMVDFLVKEKIVATTGRFVQSGYVQVPICTLLGR